MLIWIFKHKLENTLHSCVIHQNWSVEIKLDAWIYGASNLMMLIKRLKKTIWKKRMFLIYYTGLQPMLSWKRWTKSIQHFAVVCFLLQILSKHYNLNCTKETLIWIENAKSTWNVYVNNELVSGSCCIHVCSYPQR